MQEFQIYLEHFLISYHYQQPILLIQNKLLFHSLSLYILFNSYIATTYRWHFHVFAFYGHAFIFMVQSIIQSCFTNIFSIQKYRNKYSCSSTIYIAKICFRRPYRYIFTIRVFFSRLFPITKPLKNSSEYTFALSISACILSPFVTCNSSLNNIESAPFGALSILYPLFLLQSKLAAVFPKSYSSSPNSFATCLLCKLGHISFIIYLLRSVFLFFQPLLYLLQ